MRVFLAGSTGAIGRSLVPRLVAGGHEVIGLIHRPDRANVLRTLGGTPVLADPFDRIALTAAVEQAEPEVVMHQLTALAGSGDFRKFDEEFALTNRFRTEVLDTLLAAADRVRARRFIAQSFCGWPFARKGSRVKTEDDPLDSHPPATFRRTLGAIRHLESAVENAARVEALALRYGTLYGSGTHIARAGLVAELVRKRRLPIIGNGTGVWSFVHVRDVADATVTAMTPGTPGIYNIVDADPPGVAN